MSGELARVLFVVLCGHAFTLSELHVEGSLPAYCGKEPDDYVPLTKGDKGVNYNLKQVHVLIRHGDRTKIGPEPCWSNDTAVWDCLLSSASLPVIKHDIHGLTVDRLYRDVYMPGRNDNPGDCGSGHLTFRGYKQQKLNGEALRKAYVDSGFLSTNYTNQEVFLRCDDESRTRQSAQALALGLFPPSAPKFGKSEIVDINVMDKDYDDIEPNPRLCPKLDQYTTEFFASAEWQAHYNEYTLPLIRDLQQALGITHNLTMNDIRNIGDCLCTHVCHGFPIPSSVSSDLMQRVEDELTYSKYAQYSYPSIEKYAKVGMGFLIKEIWEAMQEAMEGGKARKFYLYSGHDTTVMPFLRAFNASDNQWAPYAAMIQLELLEVSNGSSTDHAVRLLYNGKERSVPYCDHSPCAMTQFNEYIKTITPQDPAVECKVSNPATITAGPHPPRARPHPPRGQRGT